MHPSSLLAAGLVAAVGLSLAPPVSLGQDDGGPGRAAPGGSDAPGSVAQSSPRIAQAARPGSDAWFWQGRDYYWGQNQPGSRMRAPRNRDGGTFYFYRPGYRYFPYYAPYPGYYDPVPYYGPYPRYAPPRYYGPRPYYGRRHGGYLRRGIVPPQGHYGRGVLYDNFYSDDW